MARVHLEPRPPAPTAAVPDATDDADAYRWGAAVRAGYFGGPLFGEGLEVFRRVDGWDLGLAAYYGAADLGSAVGGQVTTDPSLAGFHVDELALTTSLATFVARTRVYEHVDVTAGLGYRQTSGRLALTRDDGQGTLSATAAVSSVILSATVGSYWLWPNGIFLGADWLGVNVPLASTRHVTTATSGSVPSGSQSDLRTQAETLARTLALAPGIVLLLGSLGWRF